MVLPPNRVGGIRGPLGSTLDTVVAAIEALTAAVSNPVNGLPGIAAELTALLLETRKLTGPAPLPGNWPGLPVYLNTVIGTSPAATEEGQSLFGINLEAKNALQLTQGGLFGAFPPTPAARVAELVTQATLAVARLGELREYLEALSLVTGTVEGPPLGSTIKDLLRSIDVTQAALLECCEGGEPPPPSNPVNTIPTGLCQDYTYGPIRATSIETGDTPVEVGSLDPSYVLQFGDISSATGGSVLIDGSSGEPAFPYVVYYSPTEQPYCLQWNFTDNTVPSTMQVIRFGGSDFYSGVGSSVNINVGGAGPGSYQFTVNSLIRFAIVVNAPATDPPPALNFWLSVGNEFG